MTSRLLAGCNLPRRQLSCLPLRHERCRYVESPEGGSVSAAGAAPAPIPKPESEATTVTVSKTIVTKQITTFDSRKLRPHILFYLIMATTVLGISVDTRPFMTLMALIVQVSLIFLFIKSTVSQRI